MVTGFESIKNSFARFFAVLMAFVTVLSSGNFGKLNVAIPEDVYTWSDELVYEVINGTITTVNFGENFEIEKKNGNDWVKLEGRYIVKDIAYVINPVNKLTFKLNIEDVFGQKFEEGEYRLTVAFNNGTVSSVEFRVRAEILEAE